MRASTKSQWGTKFDHKVTNSDFHVEERSKCRIKIWILFWRRLKDRWGMFCSTKGITPDRLIILGICWGSPSIRLIVKSSGCTADWFLKSRFGYVNNLPDTCRSMLTRCSAKKVAKNERCIQGKNVRWRLVNFSIEGSFRQSRNIWQRLFRFFFFAKTQVKFARLIIQTKVNYRFLLHDGRF